MTGSLMLMIMYGIKSKSETDILFVVAERGVAAMGRAMVPGAFLVDVFPVCKHMSCGVLECPDFNLLQ
jgi:hypothetical protein